jgi:hypothetical protein
LFGSKRRAQKKAAEQAAEKTQLRTAITNLIALAGGQEEKDPDWPLVLKPGERLFSTLTGGGLFEPRREPGHWSGRSAGVSVPTGVAGIRVRVGKSAGTYVQGEEKPTIIDTGNASITTQRVVFQGNKCTREWDYSKLIAIIHYSDQPMTAIQVSNRQKTSGIVYAGVGATEPIRLALTVAVAVFKGEAEETIKELKAELAQLDAVPPPLAPTDSAKEAQPPVAPTAPPAPPAAATSEPEEPPPMPPPMWAQDPTGRHEFRYWDGTRWTDYVADNGTESRDPEPVETSKQQGS